MSKITIPSINKTSVTTPSGNTVTLFSDNSNNNNPSVKYSDGSVKDLTGQGGSVTGGTYSAETITINNSDGTNVSITGITSDVVLGNIAYVDYVNGDDATGSKGYLTKPYKTISAAESGVTSGDTIIITTMQYNEINLGKDQVIYHFLPGAGVTNPLITGLPSDWFGTKLARIFTDTNKTSSGVSPISFKITGWGDFKVVSTPTDRGALIAIEGGSDVEFNVRSSTIIDSSGNTADIGYHFWSQSDFLPQTHIASLKGRVERDCIGGHYFLGAHSGNANIDVGGNVDISAIFCQGEGTQLIDLNVDGKITCGYCVNDSYKYFISVDRVPWFTGNVDTIPGTNTFKVTAKRMEWINSGAAQTVNFNVINVREYHDATGVHKLNYVDINIDEMIIKSGNSATQRSVFKIDNNNSETYSRVKLDKCKLTVEDGFTLFNFNGTNEKAYLDIMFQDCSIDYKHDSLGSGAVLIPIRYAMFHIINSRFKVSAQGVSDGYILLDDSSNTDKNVQIDNVVTNAVIPTTLLNYGVALSSDSSGVRSGVTDIRII